MQDTLIEVTIWEGFLRRIQNGNPNPMTVIAPGRSWALSVGFLGPTTLIFAPAPCWHAPLTTLGWGRESTGDVAGPCL